MLSTFDGVAAAPGRGAAEPGTVRRSDGHRGAPGLGVQEWPDGSILKSIAYWMTIQYDSTGRTTTCDIRVGVDNNVTRYTYEYDADSQLQSASVNERPQWRYSYDLNGNINLLSHGTSAR